MSGEAALIDTGVRWRAGLLAGAAREAVASATGELVAARAGDDVVVRGVARRGGGEDAVLPGAGFGVRVLQWVWDRRAREALVLDTGGAVVKFSAFTTRAYRASGAVTAPPPRLETLHLPAPPAGGVRAVEGCVVYLVRGGDAAGHAASAGPLRLSRRALSLCVTRVFSAAAHQPQTGAYDLPVHTEDAAAVAQRKDRKPEAAAAPVVAWDVTPTTVAALFSVPRDGAMLLYVWQWVDAAAPTAHCGNLVPPMLSPADPAVAASPHGPAPPAHVPGRRYHVVLRLLFPVGAPGAASPLRGSVTLSAWHVLVTAGGDDGVLIDLAKAKAQAADRAAAGPAAPAGVLAAKDTATGTAAFSGVSILGASAAASVHQGVHNAGVSVIAGSPRGANPRGNTRASLCMSDSPPGGAGGLLGAASPPGRADPPETAEQFLEPLHAATQSVYSGTTAGCDGVESHADSHAPPRSALLAVATRRRGRAVPRAALTNTTTLDAYGVVRLPQGLVTPAASCVATSDHVVFFHSVRGEEHADAVASEPPRAVFAGLGLRGEHMVAPQPPASPARGGAAAPRRLLWVTNLHDLRWYVVDADEMDLVCAGGAGKQGVPVLVIPTACDAARVHLPLPQNDPVDVLCRTALVANHQPDAEDGGTASLAETEAFASAWVEAALASRDPHAVRNALSFSQRRLPPDTNYSLLRRVVDRLIAYARDERDCIPRFLDVVAPFVMATLADYPHANAMVHLRTLHGLVDPSARPFDPPEAMRRVWQGEAHPFDAPEPQALAAPPAPQPQPEAESDGTSTHTDASDAPPFRPPPPIHGDDDDRSSLGLESGAGGSAASLASGDSGDGSLNPPSSPQTHRRVAAYLEAIGGPGAEEAKKKAPPPAVLHDTCRKASVFAIPAVAGCEALHSVDDFRTCLIETAVRHGVGTMLASINARPPPSVCMKWLEARAAEGGWVEEGGAGLGLHASADSESGLDSPQSGSSAAPVSPRSEGGDDAASSYSGSSYSRAAAAAHPWTYVKLRSALAVLAAEMLLGGDTPGGVRMLQRISDASGPGSWQAHLAYFAAHTVNGNVRKQLLHHYADALNLSDAERAGADFLREVEGLLDEAPGRLGGGAIPYSAARLAVAPVAGAVIYPPSYNAVPAAFHPDAAAQGGAAAAARQAPPMELEAGDVTDFGVAYVGPVPPPSRSAPFEERGRYGIRGFFCQISIAWGMVWGYEERKCAVYDAASLAAQPDLLPTLVTSAWDADILLRWVVRHHDVPAALRLMPFLCQRYPDIEFPYTHDNEPPRPHARLNSPPLTGPDTPHELGLAGVGFARESSIERRSLAAAAGDPASLFRLIFDVAKAYVVGAAAFEGRPARAVRALALCGSLFGGQGKLPKRFGAWGAATPLPQHRVRATGHLRPVLVTRRGSPTHTPPGGENTPGDGGAASPPAASRVAFTDAQPLSANEKLHHDIIRHMVTLPSLALAAYAEHHRLWDVLWRTRPEGVSMPALLFAAHRRDAPSSLYDVALLSEAHFLGLHPRPLPGPPVTLTDIFKHGASPLGGLVALAYSGRTVQECLEASGQEASHYLNADVFRSSLRSSPALLSVLFPGTLTVSGIKAEGAVEAAEDEEEHRKKPLLLAQHRDGGPHRVMELDCGTTEGDATLCTAFVTAHQHAVDLGATIGQGRVHVAQYPIIPSRLPVAAGAASPCAKAPGAADTLHLVPIADYTTALFPPTAPCAAAAREGTAGRAPPPPPLHPLFDSTADDAKYDSPVVTADAAGTEDTGEAVLDRAVQWLDWLGVPPPPPLPPASERADGSDSVFSASAGTPQLTPLSGALPGGRLGATSAFRGDAAKRNGMHPMPMRTRAASTMSAATNASGDTEAEAAAAPPEPAPAGGEGCALEFEYYLARARPAAALRSVMGYVPNPFAVLTPLNVLLGDADAEDDTAASDDASRPAFTRAEKRNWVIKEVARGGSFQRWLCGQWGTARREADPRLRQRWRAFAERQIRTAAAVAYEHHGSDAVVGAALVAVAAFGAAPQRVAIDVLALRRLALSPYLQLPRSQMLDAFTALADDAPRDPALPPSTHVTTAAEQVRHLLEGVTALMAEDEDAAPEPPGGAPPPPSASGEDPEHAAASALAEQWLRDPRPRSHTTAGAASRHSVWSLVNEFSRAHGLGRFTHHLVGYATTGDWASLFMEAQVVGMNAGELYAFLEDVAQQQAAGEAKASEDGGDSDDGEEVVLAHLLLALRGAAPESPLPSPGVALSTGIGSSDAAAPQNPGGVSDVIPADGRGGAYTNLLGALLSALALPEDGGAEGTASDASSPRPPRESASPPRSPSPASPLARLLAAELPDGAAYPAGLALLDSHGVGLGLAWGGEGGPVPPPPPPLPPAAAYLLRRAVALRLPALAVFAAALVDRRGGCEAAATACLAAWVAASRSPGADDAAGGEAGGSPLSAGSGGVDDTPAVFTHEAVVRAVAEVCVAAVGAIPAGEAPPRQVLQRGFRLFRPASPLRHVVDIAHAVAQRRWAGITPHTARLAAAQRDANPSEAAAASATLCWTLQNAPPGARVPVAAALEKGGWCPSAYGLCDAAALRVWADARGGWAGPPTVAACVRALCDVRAFSSARGVVAAHVEKNRGNGLLTASLSELSGEVALEEAAHRCLGALLHCKWITTNPKALVSLLKQAMALCQRHGLDASTTSLLLLSGAAATLHFYFPKASPSAAPLSARITVPPSKAAGDSAVAGALALVYNVLWHKAGHLAVLRVAQAAVREADALVKGKDAVLRAVLDVLDTRMAEAEDVYCHLGRGEGVRSSTLFLLTKAVDALLEGGRGRQVSPPRHHAAASPGGSASWHHDDVLRVNAVVARLFPVLAARSATGAVLTPVRELALSGVRCLANAAQECGGLALVWVPTVDPRPRAATHAPTEAMPELKRARARSTMRDGAAAASEGLSALGDSALTALAERVADGRVAIDGHEIPREVWAALDATGASEAVMPHGGHKKHSYVQSPPPRREALRSPRARSEAVQERGSQDPAAVLSVLMCIGRHTQTVKARRACERLQVLVRAAVHTGTNVAYLSALTPRQLLARCLRWEPFQPLPQRGAVAMAGNAAHMKGPLNALSVEYALASPPQYECDDAAALCREVLQVHDIPVLDVARAVADAVVASSYAPMAMEACRTKTLTVVISDYIAEEAEAPPQDVATEHSSPLRRADHCRATTTPADRDAMRRGLLDAARRAFSDHIAAPWLPPPPASDPTSTPPAHPQTGLRVINSQISITSDTDRGKDHQAPQFHVAQHRALHSQASVDASRLSLASDRSIGSRSSMFGAASLHSGGGGPLLASGGGGLAKSHLLAMAELCGGAGQVIVGRCLLEAADAAVGKLMEKEKEKGDGSEASVLSAGGASPSHWRRSVAVEPMVAALVHAAWLVSVDYDHALSEDLQMRITNFVASCAKVNEYRALAPLLHCAAAAPGITEELVPVLLARSASDAITTVFTGKPHSWEEAEASLYTFIQARARGAAYREVLQGVQTSLGMWLDVAGLLEAEAHVRIQEAVDASQAAALRRQQGSKRDKKSKDDRGDRPPLSPRSHRRRPDTMGALLREQGPPLRKAESLLADAAQHYLRAGSCEAVRRCLSLYRLVNLQAQHVITDLQLICLTQTGARSVMADLTSFADAEVVASSYDINRAAEWLVPVFTQVIQGGNGRYWTALTHGMPYMRGLYPELVQLFVSQKRTPAEHDRLAMVLDDCRDRAYVEEALHAVRAAKA